VVQIGSGFKKTKEIHIRQQKQGSADRPTNHNPSAVVGPNGSRTGTNRENEFQPSTMSKIAGECVNQTKYSLKCSLLLPLLLETKNRLEILSDNFI
jgi:hypothetical protein